MKDLEQEDIARVAALSYAWEKLKGKRVLVSGGTGFLGRFAIEVLKYRNERFGDRIGVVSLTRRGGCDEAGVSYLRADITEPVAVEGNVDYILHLASNTHPKQYAADPVGTVTTNVLGCNNLLKLAVEKKSVRFLLASSVEIYGDGTETPMKEDYCGYIDCNTARAGYNESKRVSESLCQSYRAQYGLECVTARFARCFGADRKEDSKAIAQFLRNALNGEDIVLKSKGAQRFSYCYVADAVSGLFKALLDGADGEAYNVSADDEGKTLGGYAELIAGFAGRKVVYDFDESKNQGVSRANFALLDCGKLKALGWKPLYSASDGFRRTYEILKTRS